MMNNSPLPAGTTYKLADKQKRNELIRQYASEHPKLRLRELAAIFGITTTRVWVILNKKAIDTTNK